MRAWTTTSTWNQTARPALSNRQLRPEKEPEIRKTDRPGGEHDLRPAGGLLYLYPGQKTVAASECTEQKDGQLVSTAWYRCEKAARAAPAAVSAAGPKPTATQRAALAKDLLGKNGSRRTCALPLHGGSICAYAAPSRWRAHLLCSKVTLASAAFSPAAGPTFVPSCSCWRSRLI